MENELFVLLRTDDNEDNDDFVNVSSYFRGKVNFIRMASFEDLIDNADAVNALGLEDSSILSPFHSQFVYKGLVYQRPDSLRKILAYEQKSAYGIQVLEKLLNYEGKLTREPWKIATLGGYPDVALLGISYSYNNGDYSPTFNVFNMGMKRWEVLKYDDLLEMSEKTGDKCDDSV